MIKKIVHKDYEFELMISFNYETDRGLYGKSWHKIQIQGTVYPKPSHFFAKTTKVLSTVSNDELLDEFDKLIKEAKDFVDNVDKPINLESFLIENGFEKFKLNK